LKPLNTIVIGIGNLLRSDDGIGLHIIEALRKENIKDNVDLYEGLSSLDILDAIKDYDRILIIDAIQSGGNPGTVYKLSLEDLKEKMTAHSFSSHLNMNFTEMFELGKKVFPNKIPKDIIIIAVEAEDITTISDRCTPKVENAITEAVDIVQNLL
jgi:hydrogenase maturation protease